MGINSYEIKAHDNFHRAGKRVFASCGDDNHDKDKTLGAFVMVNCETLTYKNIISALLNGDFYSSHGPLINELYIENRKVKIKCSDAKRISYSTRGRRSEAVNALRGEYLTEAEFEIFDTDVYFRISVTDEQGNHADTQSYYIE